MSIIKREKIVLIGAGSASFTRGLVADLILKNWEADLALVDIDADTLAVVEKLMSKTIEARRAPLRLSASTDRREALRGATAVICTIAVGGRRAWEADVLIPRKYGIFQPVGDTVMPGGTSRALRMIPAMVAIANDVLDLCPGAAFFNYGNPMAAVCRGIRKATGAPVIGLCHGVDGVAGYLAKALQVPLDEFKYTAVGINHLTWFTEAGSEGRDLMPELRGIARGEKEAPRLDLWGEANAAPPQDYPFAWQMMDLFGAFPGVLDRHICEFFPQFFASGQYYGKVLGKDAFSFEGTIERGDKTWANMRELASGSQPLGDDFFRRISGEHEKVLDILASIRRDDGAMYSANLPNRGQVSNLPADAIIESPAVATGGTLRAIAQPALSSGIAGTLATRYQWVETIVEAALEGSRTKFIQALVLDGAVSSLETAAKLADELLAAHARHLPAFAVAAK